MSACAPTTAGPTRADLHASISVFLIALPLSLGIALATGAPLQAGLVAAAAGGLVAGWLGGAPLQVSGPAAGLVLVTAELIQVYGWRTTCAITVLAGLAQLALSHLRVARWALVISPAIVHGMLAGIGLTIAVAQLHIVLGSDPASSVLTNLAALPAQLANPHPSALAVGALTLAVLLVWPRLPGRAGARVRRVAPAALAAVALGTAVAALGSLHLPRVDLPSWSSHALPQLPEGPLLGLLAAILTVTLVASVESLLSAVAVDKLAAARYARGGPRAPRTDLDRELRGQGAANVVSGALGGLPVTGVAVRSSANVAAGAVSRRATMFHGCWVVLATLLLASVLERIPLAALAALVMLVGLQLVNPAHLRSVTRHREVLVYVATALGVLLFGLLEGVGLGIATAVAVALHRLTHTRVDVEELPDGTHRVRVTGPLTFLAVPRLSRALGRIPEGSTVAVELHGALLDHAAHETLHDWRTGQEAQGGRVTVTGASGAPLEDPAGTHAPRRWLPWRPHQRPRRAAAGEQVPASRGAPAAVTEAPGADDDRLLAGLRRFQCSTAPLVRGELARLAREGQQPEQLFVTCADSRIVTSMITASRPGELFTVRNVGNLVPPPGVERGDDSVAAAIEYAVTVLRVRGITVCGHSGCGAMQALHRVGGHEPQAVSSLHRWLRHGLPSVRRLAADGAPAPRLARSADAVESLCLTNVLQQLDHLARHACVAERLAAGTLVLRGMYFHVGEAQAYVLARVGAEPPVFTPVGPGAVPSADAVPG